MLKICKKCGETKPVEAFYKMLTVKDGRAARCIECYKADVRSNREKNIDHYKEFDKQRANRPDRVDARRKYAETPAGKRATASAKARYIEKNPIKRSVHTMTRIAIRSGVLVKRPCEVCSETTVHAHHDDYANPLDVRWLCPCHHAEWHKENRPMFGGKIMEDAA